MNVKSFVKKVNNSAFILEFYLKNHVSVYRENNTILSEIKKPSFLCEGFFSVIVHFYLNFSAKCKF